MPSAPDPLETPSAPPRRAMCATCKRPVSVCYCAALTTLETDSKIVILQHPREAGMPIGTAHMAHLCLPQSSLHVGIDWDDSEVLRAVCADPERPPILLYPGTDARDILEDPPPAPVTLIVVDGTWSQARTVVRDNPRLAALPRYAFHAPTPSNYRIRREPSAECVSTLEAIMHVLGAIEGDVQRFEALRQPMDAMVDAQLRAQQQVATSGLPPRKPRARRPRTPFERLPVEMRERYEDLVLVVGEANAWPHAAPERALGDELVYWVAHRPASGETFSFVRAPRLPLAPDIPRHAEIPAARLLAGGSSAELLAAFSAFTRPTDVLCSWSHHGLRLFKACGGALTGPFFDLRDTAQRLDQEKVGRLESYAAGRLETPPIDLPPGRAGRRLGLLIGLLAAWRAPPAPDMPDGAG